jgi:hypothetical protein
VIMNLAFLKPPRVAAAAWGRFHPRQRHLLVARSVIGPGLLGIFINTDVNLTKLCLSPLFVYVTKEVWTC